MTTLDTLLLTTSLIMASGVAYAQQHVVMRKPPSDRGFMAPNNGGTCCNKAATAPTWVGTRAIGNSCA